MVNVLKKIICSYIIRPFRSYKRTSVDKKRREKSMVTGSSVINNSDTGCSINLAYFFRWYVSSDNYELLNSSSFKKRSKSPRFEMPVI